MNELRQQVARARRRLVMEQFLARSVWCLFVALAVAAVAIAAPRIFAISGLHDRWDAVWFGGAVLAALMAAVIWTVVARRSALDSAMEIDRRFDLRERVASSLSLNEEDLETEAGQALVKDAMRVASRIEVGEKFRVRFNRRAWLPLVPAALAFVLVLFVDPKVASSSIDPDSLANQQQQVKTATESARKKLEEQRKLAEKQGLKEAGNLFKQIEQGTKDLAEQKQLDRSKAAVKLNDLTQQLEERRAQLGGKEGLQKQLQGMKNLGAGPGEKVAQALKDGDWKKALGEIDKLAKELKAGNLDAKQKEELAKQLEQMKQKLQEAADSHQQAMSDLKKQIEKEREQGNMAKAGELQQKLDKMKQQQPQMDKLQKLANQMGQIQQGLQQADGQKAADALSQMAQQLDQMQQETTEAEMLDAAMAQIEMSKDAMACAECQGQGCKDCQGSMAMGSQFPNDSRSDKMGPGGMGRGAGARPEERNATNTRDSQVKQKPQKGAAVFGGLVEGPNIKGQVGQSIKEEMASLSAEPADPLTSERLPQNRREHAEEYFNMLREGK